MTSIVRGMRLQYFLSGYSELLTIPRKVHKSQLLTQFQIPISTFLMVFLNISGTWARGWRWWHNCFHCLIILMFFHSRVCWNLSPCPCPPLWSWREWTQPQFHEEMFAYLEIHHATFLISGKVHSSSSVLLKMFRFLNVWIFFLDVHQFFSVSLRLWHLNLGDLNHLGLLSLKGKDRWCHSPTGGCSAAESPV